MKKLGIKIDDEFKNLIPPLTPEEYLGLERSIISEGCRDPLVLWDGIILDGHNRYSVCQKHGIIFKTVSKNLDSREDAKVWILENQLGRRNLNDAQRIDIVDKLFGLKEKNDANKRVQEKLNKRDHGGKFATQVKKGKTRDSLAKKAKVSPRQYGKGTKVKEKSLELWNKCLSGEISIDAAYNEVRHHPEVKTEQIKEIIQLTSPNIDFRLGDFREILTNVPDNSVDIIITDPPYDKESVHLYEDLAILAKRVLKKNSFCIAYAGCMFLPDLLTLMSNHLDYYWTFALVYPNKNNCRVMGRSIFQYWKPFLVFQNGFKKNTDFFKDVINGSGRDKKSHKWQQSNDELKSIIEFFTDENDIILDPMAGSGSTLIISRKLNRRVIGCEINEDTYNSANKRIRDELNERLSKR